MDKTKYSINVNNPMLGTLCREEPNPVKFLGIHNSLNETKSGIIIEKKPGPWSSYDP